MPLHTRTTAIQYTRTAARRIHVRPSKQRSYTGARPALPGQQAAGVPPDRPKQGEQRPCHATLLLRGLPDPLTGRAGACQSCCRCRSIARICSMRSLRSPSCGWMASARSKARIAPGMLPEGRGEGGGREWAGGQGAGARHHPRG